MGKKKERKTTDYNIEEQQQFRIHSHRTIQARQACKSSPRFSWTLHERNGEALEICFWDLLPSKDHIIHTLLIVPKCCSLSIERWLIVWFWNHCNHISIVKPHSLKRNWLLKKSILPPKRLWIESSTVLTSYADDHLSWKAHEHHHSPNW